MRRFLKWVAPKSFEDGLRKCNSLGKTLVGKQGVDRFLDIGCGDGALTMDFADTIKPKEIFGTEFVSDLREKAEKKGIQCTQHDLNSKWDYAEDSFDVILSSQNIEHVHNTRLYLEECYRCLRPEGQLIILTENLASWINIGALVLGWQPFSTTNINGWSLGNPFIWHKDEERDERFFEKYQATGVSGAVGHVRVLAYQGLKDLMTKVGFRDVSVFARGYLPLWGVVSDFLCRIDRRHGHFLIATGYK